MITTDKVTLTSGDKVWRIVDDKIEEGEFVEDDEFMRLVCPTRFTEYLWENMGDKPEFFGNKQNAIHVLIYRLKKRAESAWKLIDDLQKELTQ